MRKLLFPLALISLTSLTLHSETPAAALLTDGDFEMGSLGNANSWPKGNGITLEEENGNHFLRLEATEPGKQIQAYRKVPLPSGLQKIKVSFRARANDITPGAENWHTGRVILHFKDAAGQVLKPDPAPFSFKGNSNGWVEKTAEFVVPEGSESLEVFPALFQIGQGSLDIDDIIVVPAE